MLGVQGRAFQVWGFRPASFCVSLTRCFSANCRIFAANRDSSWQAGRCTAIVIATESPTNASVCPWSDTLLNCLFHWTVSPSPREECLLVSGHRRIWDLPSETWVAIWYRSWSESCWSGSPLTCGLSWNETLSTECEWCASAWIIRMYRSIVFCVRCGATDWPPCPRPRGALSDGMWHTCFRNGR